MSYQDLYAHWEGGHWSATDIDLRSDRREWLALAPEERQSLEWQLSMFFCGEDTVADSLGPYIEAAPSKEQQHLLVTQQVDEVRHSIFFARVIDEVLDAGPTLDASLERYRPALSWQYQRLLQDVERAAEDLRHDRSQTAFVRSVTIYHLFIEAVLARPGLDMLNAYMATADCLPGIREGLSNVLRDEHRHIAFGVKVIADLISTDDACRATVLSTVGMMAPRSIVFRPAGPDRDHLHRLGSSAEELARAGQRALETHLMAAGLTREELASAFSVRHNMRGKESAEV